MKIATSYFYQIRNFKPWMIPVSTALGDPDWYKPPIEQEWYIDKRGIVCGLRYEPLIVQKTFEVTCPCELRGAGDQCDFLINYRAALEQLDFDKTIKAFQYCADKFCRPFDDEEPIIVLMVHEAWNNPCSERKGLQDYFTAHGWNCKELEYPIQ